MYTPVALQRLTEGQVLQEPTCTGKAGAFLLPCQLLSSLLLNKAFCIWWRGNALKGITGLLAAYLGY